MTRPRFTQVLDGALEDFAEAADLSEETTGFLSRLVPLVDWVDADLRATAVGLAEHLRYRDPAGGGRRRITRQLAEAVTAGAVEWTPGGPGGQRGRLVILIYDRLVQRDEAQLQREREQRARRALSSPPPSDHRAFE